jgi:hypothetical protein
MTQVEILCGSYKPASVPPGEGWQLDFFQSNIVPVMELVDPNAFVRVEGDDWLYIEPADRKMDRLLSYVRVEHGAPDFTDAEVSGGIHYFIYRPRAFTTGAKAFGFGDGFVPNVLCSMWNFLAYSVRRFLQKMHRAETRHTPLSALMARGVPAEVVRKMQEVARATIDHFKLDGQSKFDYLDAVSAALYVSCMVSTTARQRPITPADIAQWATI